MFIFFLDICDCRMINGFVSVVFVLGVGFVTEVVYVQCLHYFLILFFVSEVQCLVGQ